MQATTSESCLKNGAAFGVLVTLLYFLSGAVGLTYQVLWARMLSLQFGVSIFGVVITAAAFMIGLGMGALQGHRWARTHSAPLRIFALIEICVALYALSLPFLLKGVDDLVLSLGSITLEAWYGVYSVATLLMVAIPAWAMGVGFPMVLRSLEGTSISLAKIYGINTLGGALGALLPLWLLPTLGWAAAIWVVALVGMLVGGVAWSMSRTQHSFVVEKRSVHDSVAPIMTILAYGGVGAAALMLEIGWTRLFGMLLLRTEYVMAVILAVFLVGIGGGSLIARHLRAQGWFNVLPVMAGAFALISLWALPPLARWAESSEFTSLSIAMVSQGLAIALLTLPVTLLLGAWLPLLNRRLGHDHAAGALLYGANSVGAALGAVIAGFVLLPWLGTSGTIVFAAFVLYVCGMAWSARKAWVALPLLLLLAWPVAILPEAQGLLPKTLANSRDLMVHEDALGLTHVIERDDGQRLLLADLQRMDASSEPRAVVSQQNQVRLPLLLHPDPRSVLFLGLGTGISASASLSFPGLERTAVELSQGAIEGASHWFDRVNGGVVTQMDLIRDDARRFLRTVDRSFDVIIGDLFHPDFVGRSALLSLQQFQRAKARLNTGGLFVQWLALNQFDPATLTVVLRGFNQVFDNGVIFVDGFRMALVGSKGGQLSADATLANLARVDQATQQRVTGGEGAWTWLGRYWGHIETGSGPTQDEWAPVIEYRLPRVRYGGEMDMAKMEKWLLSQRSSLESALAYFGVGPAQKESFERAFIATDLGHRAWLAEFQGRAREAQRLMQLAYQANPRDGWISSAIADRMYASLDQMAARGVDREEALKTILQIYPDHVESIKALWQLLLARGKHSEAEQYRQRLVLLSPLDRALGTL